MRGLPGAGKSTWVRDNRPDARVCSADSFFRGEDGSYRFDPSRLQEAHSDCLLRFVELLSSGEQGTVVVDNTCLRSWEIAPYYSLAAAMGLEPTIVHVSCDPETAYRRNVHGVEREQIDTMSAALEEETLPSSWRLVYA